MNKLKTESVVNTDITIIEKPVTFGTHSIELQGRLYLPSTASQANRVPGTVICHGYGGDKLAFENSARDLCSEGIAVLTFDFRGHGASGGKLDGSVVDDVIDAWDYLRGRPEIDQKRMGLIGHSMGAFSAILAAGKLREAKALVTLSCPGEIRNKIALNPRHFANPLLKLFATCMFQAARIIFKFQIRVDWKKFIEFWPRMKPSQSLADLHQCSKLFVFCLDDFTSPYSRFVYSYSMAAEPKQMMVTPGNHNTPVESESLRKQWQKWTISTLHGKYSY